MPLRSLLLVVLLTHPVLAQTGTVPADRPRSRPPSALTGWADWEKGKAVLFTALHPVLASGGSLRGHDAETMASGLSMTEGALRTALVRLLRD